MKILLTLLFSSFLWIGRTQNTYFPPLSTSQWDTVSPSSLGWCTGEIDQLYNYLETNNTKAFIVLKDGKIALEKYFDSFTQDSIWYWASAGKTLMAFTVGKAQEEGHLSITDTTSEYLGNGWTSCSPNQEEKITILHQLNMTAGMDDLVPNSHCTLPSCLQYLSDAGTRWAYHNATYTLLKPVLENATGQPLNTYFNSRVKTPIGMDGLFLTVGDNNIYFSTARSMARFGLLIQNNGEWNGNQIMTDQNYFSDMITPSQTLNESYGYLWWLNGQPSFMIPYLQTIFPFSPMPNAPSDLIAGIGKNGQLLNISNSQGLVVIRMGNAPDGNEVPFTMNDSIWQKLNLVTCGTNSVSAVSELVPTLYPNPCSTSFTLKNIKAGTTVELLSINGKVVANVQCFAHEKTIHLPTTITSGLYFVKLTYQSESTVKKLLIH